MSDVYHLDKARVRASFDRAASTYDAAAVLQAEVRTRMFDRLDLVKIAPQAILDAGCGTGRASIALAKRFNKSHIVSLDIAMGMLKQAIVSQNWFKRISGLTRQSLLCANIENLPIRSSSIGLVWSNLALQWCNDLDLVFREAHRVLQPEGLIMFSTFGPDTLKELRLAANADPDHVHVSRFIDMHDIGDALVRAGFTAPVLDVERFVLTYDDVIGVMRDLKAIGAHNATDGRNRGLQGKGFLKKLTENYEQFRQDGKLPATFEVVYGHAWKPEHRKSESRLQSEDGSIPITVHKKEMNSGYFITGTDTGVGKTLIASALVRQFAQGGLKSIGMKPVAAGCELVNGELISEDVTRLIAASNVAAPLAQINPYAFEPAIAPHIAAQEARVEIELATIQKAYQALAARADVVVVEGAGGFCVPLGDSLDTADLAKALNLPIILVVGMRLGCLNHTLLTAEAIQARGLILAGWVANQIDPHMQVFDENLGTLKQRIAAPCVSTVLWNSRPDLSVIRP